MSRIDWKPLHVALDREAAIDLGIEALMTDVVSSARAVEIYAQARRDRATTGMTPIILAEESLDFLWGGGGEDELTRVKSNLAAFETTTAAQTLGAGDAKARDFERELDALLDRLGKLGACDPMTILHRLDNDLLGEIEADEGEVEIDPDYFGPDDVAQAYREALAARADLVTAASASAGGMPAMYVDTVRPYDVDTALAQLWPGRSRVALLRTDPARALLYLDYGGVNDCPAGHVHARVWQHWFDTIGAEPAVISGPMLIGIAARPVTTRSALVQLAREIAFYDRDAIDGLLPLLGALVHNARLQFWWD